MTVQHYCWFGSQQAEDFPASAEQNREEKRVLGLGVSYSGGRESRRAMGTPSFELFDKKSSENGQSVAWVWSLWRLGRDVALNDTTRG